MLIILTRFQSHYLCKQSRFITSSISQITHNNMTTTPNHNATIRTTSSSSSDTSSTATAPVYENNDYLNMYLGLHYPKSGLEEGVESIISHTNAPVHGLDFPQRMVQILISLQKKQQKSQSSSIRRALDIGCAVGGSSFELAKYYDHVEAFDFSESFVNTAKKIQKGENIHFRIPIEADIYKEVKVHHVYNQNIVKNVRFFTGDACKLSEYQTEIGNFDGVIMSNLLCRLPNPIASLEGLSKVVNTNGIVVILTPYSWLEQFTAKEQWLGGYYDEVTKQPLFSKDNLLTLMKKYGFEKIHEEQVPLIIREHQRKYQYIVTEATGWRRL